MAELPDINLQGPKPTFQRFGRSYHLRISTIDDLRYILDMDEAHWVATSSPLSSILCDEVFTSWIDSDQNGRVLPWEIRDAIRWLLRVLKDYEGVEEKSDVLRLTAINIDDDDGRRAIESSKKMLDRLNADDFTQISLEQIRTIKQRVESMPVSEAGVVLPEATEDERLRTFLKDIVTCLGGVPHPSGAQGVNRPMLNQFLNEADGYLQWRDKGKIPDGEQTTAVKPLGEQTAESFAAFDAVREKINRYFAQCRAVQFDPNLAAQLVSKPDRVAEIDFTDPKSIETFLGESMIALPRADNILDLTEGINPADQKRIAKLREEALTPLLGEDVTQLTAAQWKKVKEELKEFDQWLSSKVGQAIEPLGVEKLRDYLDPTLREAVEAFISQSNETAFALDNIRLTEKLALYQSLLIEYLNNYVSFPNLYDHHRRAMFERGTLVMDARRFNLAVKVENHKEHSAVAKNGSMCVLYVQISSKLQPDAMELAVPVTSGGIGNLAVGKRGIFIDLDNKLWDARVIHVIENPISLREAVVAPFKRLGALITGKIESMTTSAEKKLDAAGSSTFDQIHTTAVKGDATPTPATSTAATQQGQQQQGNSGSLLAGGGIAIAALGSATAYIARTVEMLAKPHIILVVIFGAILAVLIPTTIIAWLKLRKRDLSAILEGAGWAINAQMRLTWSQSRFFTLRPPYPIGAHGVGSLGWGQLLWSLVAVAVIVGSSFTMEMCKYDKDGPRPQKTKQVQPKADATPSTPAAETPAK